MSSSLQTQHHQINYLEFPAKDLKTTKEFFTAVFGWSFVDYGPEYTAFYSGDAGMDGGFFQADLTVSTTTGSVLVVLYSTNLEATLSKIDATEGGAIVKPIFAFPGGKRFHFSDPNGNEYAVWSDS